MAKKVKHYIDITTHKAALRELGQDQSEILGMLWTLAINISLGIGEERLEKKVYPALATVAEQFADWSKAGGRYYAKQKLLQAVNEVCKKDNMTLRIDKFVLDDGEVL